MSILGGKILANRIKGITVEIGRDTTKLQTALKHPEASVRIPATVLQIFYIVYVFVMMLCLVRYLKR